jgi:protein-tyrosine phosphatase
MTQILMVCTANICRSPMAQIVSAHLVKKAGLASQVKIESAGTQAGRIREPADPRTTKVLAKRDYPSTRVRSRRVAIGDFDRFDLILAMDQSNMNDLRQVCPNEHAHKLRMFLEFAPELGLLEVPDPYFGGPLGFEKVLDLCEAAARGLIAQLKSGGAQPPQVL